eukprot:CAMPEP_0179072062 /NCGR_PEP_ID=MMETSP0796-20121207/31857_1 /TAXON_ID=73915 /ORGANISM="Pyrodinium bahamense, Strain pbaha01" /LENGTH=323 /DNA_ID=CAMNT_0020769203 /DNA_START=182 /DNA_END=1153 /DNA_ORIENTATION=+
MTAEAQACNLRHVQCAADFQQWVEGGADVQVEVAIELDVRQQHEPRELQLQGELAQRGRGGEDHCLGADVLLGRAPPAEGDLLQRAPLVVHVAQADDVLPGLARVPGVEARGLVLHGDVLCNGQGALSLFLVEVLARVPDGLQLRRPALRLGAPLARVHDLDTVLPEERQQLGHEARRALLHPGALRVGDDDAALAEGARLEQALHQRGSPLAQLVLARLWDRHIRADLDAPAFQELRRREERVVPIQEEQRLGRFRVQLVRGRHAGLARRKPAEVLEPLGARGRLARKAPDGILARKLLALLLQARVGDRWHPSWPSLPCAA